MTIYYKTVDRTCVLSWETEPHGCFHLEAGTRSPHGTCLTAAAADPTVISPPERDTTPGLTPPPDRVTLQLKNGTSETDAQGLLRRNSSRIFFQLYWGITDMHLPVYSKR